jgi:hypothetical protein
MGKGRKLFPYISPLAPFLDPGSRVFENPKEYGYRLFCHTLEEHRKALLEPSWKQMLNYETEWMTRDEIVESTYQSALRLNRVKCDHGLIKLKKFREIEKRIRGAQDIIRAIDKQLTKRGSAEAQADIVQNKELVSVESLRIGNIISLILRGDDLSAKRRKRPL